MPIALEQSKWETEGTENPKQVLSTKAFSGFITGKNIKNVIWDDKRNSWLAIEFTDNSRLVIADTGLVAQGVNLRYVTPPPK